MEREVLESAGMIPVQKQLPPSTSACVGSIASPTLVAMLQEGL